jgi:hypothetical protein
MQSVVLPNYVHGSATVNPRQHFGKNRCVFTTVGNLMFLQNDTELYFKGVRCVQALQRVLENITASNVVCMQVSMLVMTLSLGCNLDVRCHGTLHQKLKYTFGPAIKFLFRSEEQSNAVLFSVQDWRQIFKAAGNDYTWKHDLVPSTTISFTQNGSCTLRMTFQGKRDLAQWSEPFAQAHEAAIAIGSVLISLAQS